MICIAKEFKIDMDSIEMSNKLQIYYIESIDLENIDYLENSIYSNINCNYYWSNNWSKEFYIELAYAGFITITTEDDESNLLLLPEMQFGYSILDFKDLHIPKKVRSLIRKDNFIFTVNKNFNENLESIVNHHSDNWLYGEYITLLEDLLIHKDKKRNFKLLSIELSCKKTKKIVAGEIGYSIGKTYTSLTGFYSKEKEYNNYGKLQLVLLAKLLEKNGFSFWNLGHPYMDYKNSLGAKIYSREEFLKRWIEARD